MDTQSRALRPLRLVAALLALAVWFGLAGPAPARATPLTQGLPFRVLQVGYMLKWDPVANASDSHVYQVSLNPNVDQQSATFLIGVLSLGLTTFTPIITATHIDDTGAGSVCSGYDTTTSGRDDELISCTVNNTTKGNYRITVSNASGSPITDLSYAIYAVAVTGLPTINTNAQIRQTSINVLSVYAYSYTVVSSVPTATLTLPVATNVNVNVRAYDDATNLACREGQVCNLQRPSIKNYYVLVTVLQVNQAGAEFRVRLLP